MRLSLLLLSTLLLLLPLIAGADDYGRGYCDARRHQREALLGERDLEAKRLGFPLSHEDHVSQVLEEERHRDEWIPWLKTQLATLSSADVIMRQWDLRRIPPSLNGQTLYINRRPGKHWTVHCPSGERYDGPPRRQPG